MSRYNVPVWVCNVCGKARLNRLPKWMAVKVGSNPYSLDEGDTPKGWKIVGNDMKGGNLHACSKKCAAAFYTEQEKKFRALAKGQA